MTSNQRLRGLAEAYLDAKEFVIDAGFESEIDWQEGLSVELISEQQFLSEAGWVVLSSGMSEAAVRSSFERVSEAFLGWESAEKIVLNSHSCRRRALSRFQHPGKISAILRICSFVYGLGFSKVLDQLREDPVHYLRRLPYMGPATSCHLAKNLGFTVAKPDRHLRRIAAKVGFQSVAAMCEEVSTMVAEPVTVVDLVFWRFATLRRDYLDFFTLPASGQPTGGSIC